MMDPKKIKEFWDARAKVHEKLPFESIANLEQDPEHLKLKVTLETEKVFDYLKSVAGKTIIDFGAGVGQWALRFAERGAAYVTAVEYSEPLVEIGEREAARRGVANVRFVVSAAEDYYENAQYDVVFISGLFVYMNDTQAATFVHNLRAFCKPTTIVLLRDGTAVNGRYEIEDRFSEHLQTNYSATYRKRAAYLSMFEEEGFVGVRDENMFDEGCPLNKYSETRLRIYLFRPA